MAHKNKILSESICIGSKLWQIKKSLTPYHINPTTRTFQGKQAIKCCGDVANLQKPRNLFWEIWNKGLIIVLHVWNAHLEQIVHLKQSWITVHAFWDTNVNVCYVWLIASYLRCDVIVCYVWLIASHLRCDVIVCYVWLIAFHLRCDVIVCYVWLIASHLKCDVIVCYIWLGWCISSEVWCDYVLYLVRLIVSHLKCDVIVLHERWKYNDCQT